MNYETEILDFIDRIHEGEVLFDLGAAEGRFAIYAALKRVRTWAFEPEEMNFQALLENLELNPAARPYLTPVQRAVGDQNVVSILNIAPSRGREDISGSL